jgi:VWFA-related protein
MARPGRRTAAWVVAFALALGCLAGRAEPVAQDTFRSGVEVVVIDVTIVDRSGQPVSGLTAADFRVNVDRKPRPIASAQFLAHDMRLAARPTPRPTPPSGNLHVPGRDILIVVDEDSMEPGTGLVARRAAERFLDTLAPADRAGVATIPRVRTTVSLTTNRSDVRKALRQVIAGNANTSQGAYWIGVAEALDIERNDPDAMKKVVDRECRGSYPERIDLHCVKDVLAEAHQVAMQTRLRAQRSLDALQQLADGLRQLEGPKTMVLISGGMPMPEATESFSRLSAAFARGQVSLYTVFVESMSQGNTRNRQSPSYADDDRVEADGIENMTASAGGSLVPAIGTVESSLDRVATELSGSYLLGIEVAATDRDGAPHFVDVKVERPGVEVRARKQYVIARPTLPQAGVVTADARSRAAARPDNAPKVREVDVTPPDVEAVVARASRYVTAYETTFSGLVAEEHYQQRLSKWKSRGTVTARELTERGEWSLESKRELRSDYLLVKAPELAGWMPFRDVFEVDGEKVRERDQRLQRLFLEAPNSAWDRANDILNESARYNIGYTRNTNLPTLALMFLHPANRDRFVFSKAGESTVDGMAVWQVDYRERARPTLVRNVDTDLPAEGRFWIDPAEGRVLRTALRLKAQASSVDILVLYRQSDKLGEIFVPAEMRETATTAEAKLECVAQYTNFRRFQVTTDVQIPK